MINKPEVNKSRERVGRYGDRVRLNVWIMAAQDREIDQFCNSTGMSKTDAITEAIHYWINSQRKMGVL